MNERRHPELTTAIATRLGAGARSNRLAQGLTLAQVCERARTAGHRLDVGDLSKLERGEPSWTTARLAAVSAGLGLKFPLWCLGVVSEATPEAAPA